MKYILITLYMHDFIYKIESLFIWKIIIFFWLSLLAYYDAYYEFFLYHTIYASLSLYL